MFWKLLILTVSLLLLESCTAGSKKYKRWTEGDEIDIDSNQGTTAFESSGNGPATSDDEDDAAEGTEGSAEDSITNFSGDGSGFARTREENTSVPDITRALTACQQLRRSVVNPKLFRYNCTENGEFQKLQCHHQTGECWCVDSAGTVIPGTSMEAPKKPGCISGQNLAFGQNLKPCVFQLLKNINGLLGTYRPRCDFSGEFEKIQCHVMECWCVDSKGKETPNTRVSKHGASPVCEVSTTTTTLKPTTRKATPAVPRFIASTKSTTTTTKKHHRVDKDKNGGKGDGGVYIIPTPDEDDKHTLQTDKFDKDGREEIDDENRHTIGKTENLGDRGAETKTLHIMARPGLLAAVIGGAVVGLLCAVLLVMFIVYRMRKKDEGSYALEEQKYTNCSYMKAPDKEFYA